MSQTEPELGLGLVLKVEPDRVNIVFPSSESNALRMSGFLSRASENQLVCA